MALLAIATFGCKESPLTRSLPAPTAKQSQSHRPPISLPPQPVQWPHIPREELIANFLVGLGYEGEAISLNENDSFEFRHTCCVKQTRAHGKVEIQDETIVLIAEEWEVDQHDGIWKPQTPTWRKRQYIPVKWDERLYLLQLNQIFPFINEINKGNEPRDSNLGWFLLRQGDEAKPVSGPPSLPPEYVKYVRR